MTINIKQYQQIAIDELIKSVGELLCKDSQNKICVFQSPTGSGKTVMVAKFIEGIIKDLPDIDLCFIWVSIGKGELHKQSKNSLDNIFEGFPKCELVEEEFFGSRTFIDQNEVVVVNWEKLRSKDKLSGDWKNKVMKEGEETNFIKVLQNTKEKRKIILIIDESHFASDTERTNELRQIVNADVTLEMSATPKLTPSAQEIKRGNASYIYVEPKDVIDEGMIKKELIINEGIDKLVTNEKTSQDIIIEASFNKRIELKNAFQSIGSDINPLCLIQLPNAESGIAKREVIEAFLAEKGITEENGKLAIWLTEEKTNTLKDISKNDNDIEFLIFKQAIDTGWDCPRAQILVKLRDIQSYTFEVQTVGRIMRMPEQKHYLNEVLNIGYIFTNLERIVVEKEEYNPNIIKHLKANRKIIYKDIKLLSYYKSRVDFGDITSSFYSILENVFCEEFGIDPNSVMINIAENSKKLIKKGLVVEIKKYQDHLIRDEKISSENIDNIHGNIGRNESFIIGVQLSDNDLLDTFNQLIKENLNGFAPKRSIPTVKQSIYLWFRKYLGINFTDGGLIAIQNHVLNPVNFDIYSKLLSKATGIYRPIQKEEVRKKIQEQFYSWDVKKEEFYNQYTDEKTSCKLSIYEPCYLNKERSNPEMEFEKYIENKNEIVLWWFKNGSNKKDYLGIKYIENDFPQTFYPDYIMQLKSGKIFIGDTKAGKTAVESKLRAESLQDYIKQENSKGKNLVGGIIIQDFNKKWRLNQNMEYVFDSNDLTNWSFLDDILNN